MLPSGEKTGSLLVPSPLVSRCASPPSRETIQRSPAYENAICVLESVGFCSKRGPLACAAAEKTKAKIRIVSDRENFFIRTTEESFRPGTESLSAIPAGNKEAGMKTSSREI